MSRDILMTEAALSDSVIYKSFNNNSELTTTILSAIKDSIVIDKSYIEEQILQINRTKISPLAEKVLKSFEAGEIVLLYSKTKKIPQMLPFFITRLKGEIRGIIFVNNYGTLSKSDKDSSKKYLNISMKDLYVLMEGAYVAREYAIYPTKLNKSLQLMRMSSFIYTNMILRILNKEYAVSLDLDAYHILTFCISRFFMERVWMYDNEDVVFTYAKGNINGTPNMTSLTQISDMYTSANIKTIQDLLEFCKNACPKIKGLSFRYFVQCYINTYKVGALFGLESLPYFLYTVEATLIGSFLINQPMIADVTKTTKGMNRFYPDLVKAIQ